MFLDVKISKATPERAIQYATEKNILETVITRNLVTSKSPVDEMRNTANRFGKWHSPKDRKTFSLIISPNPKDNPTEAQIIEITEAVLDHYFPTIQGLIVLHKDKGRDSRKSSPVLHSHFYGSIIDPITGKNVHLSDSDIRRIRAWADEYALRKFNWRPFKHGSQDKSKAYKKSLVEKINKRGKTGWLDRLKGNVNEVYNRATTFEEFCSLLNNRGIAVLQETNTCDIKFEIQENGKKYQVNAKTLGEQLGWDKLQRRYIEISNRRNNNDRYKRNTTEKETQLGSGNTSSGTIRTGAGACSGTGYLRKQKVDYSCVFCTKDKDICKRCIQFKQREREGHGARSL